MRYLSISAFYFNAEFVALPILIINPFMYKKTALVFLFLLSLAGFSFSQQNSISKLADSLRGSSNHEAVVKEINKLLAKNWDDTDRLLLQSVLVSKLTELQLWDSCLSYCQNQVALAHQQKNSFAEASFYKFIGNTYYNIPNKEKAVEYWRKSIEVSEPNGFAVLLSQCNHNVGVYYLELETEYKKAEFYLLKAYKASLTIYPSVSPQISLHERLLATLYEKTNQLDKSEKYYLSVIKNSRLLKDSSNLVEGLAFYSMLLTKKKDFEKSVAASKEALTIAKITNQLDQVNTVMRIHADNLYSAGNFREAYEIKQEAQGLTESRYNKDINQKIADAEAKFKNAEVLHEKQMALLKAKKEKQGYLLGFTSLILVSGYIFYYYYQKRNIKQKLQLQQQVQEEKERISRDLHDNLGSQMALLSNNIEALDINFRKNYSIDKNLEKVKENSRQLLQTLREAIWILNKEQIRAEEFFDKLIDYSQRYVQQVGGIRLETNEDFAGPKILHSNEALQLFRICQEAINNACKYSGSAALFLSGNVINGTFEIEIRDKGKGFDANSINNEGHYGIKNMKKRADEINAVLEINTKPGEGVSIQIVI